MRPAVSSHATAGGDPAPSDVTNGAAVVSAREPDHAVVADASDDSPGDFKAGFEPVGAHVVWVRQE